MDDAAPGQRPWLAHYPSAIDWHAPIAVKSLPAMLADAVARYGDRPAMDFLSRTWSYAELGHAVARATRGFQQLGVTRGTRVGLCLPNTPYYVICYFAVLACGGVVVNFNPLYAARELKHQIADAGTELMVTLDVAALYEKLKPLLGTTAMKRLVICRLARALPFPKNLLYPFVRAREVAKIPADDRHIFFERLSDNRGDPAPVAIDPGDLAVLQYTGGTTGTPKGAMLSHANLYANAVQSVTWFSVCAPGQERMLAVLPFFHVFAMTVAMTFSVYVGALIIMLPRFELKTVLETISRKRPTLFPAVPTVYTAINLAKDRDRYALGSIKACISGGAPLPVEVKQRFEQLTGCSLVEGYGLTESSPVATCNPLTGVNKTGSIGQPLPLTEIEIVSLDDGTTIVPNGERGEVCIRGPQVMMGYWQQPQETAQVLRNGRLHTGDVGYMDDEGYVFIVDRIKDLILCSGYNVYPRNVEEAIYLHAAVAECVVAGVPDAYRGQSVKAFVRIKDGQALTQGALLEFLKDKLSPIEMPKFVEFRKELPRTLVGKLSRRALLEEEAAKAAAAKPAPAG